MKLELLYWDGCPSHPRALADLKSQLRDLGIDAEPKLVQMCSDQQAAEEHFVGSPTIRIDGKDIVDSAGQPPALNCRIYKRSDGSISPTPDMAKIRTALLAALASEQATMKES